MQFTFLSRQERRQKRQQAFVDYCNKIEKEPEKVFLWLPKKIGTKVVWLEKVFKTAKWDGYYAYNKPSLDYSEYWKIVYINPKEKSQ